MAARLKSVFLNQISQLAFKAVFFGLLLYWYLASGSFLAAAVFAVSAILLYLKPVFNLLLFKWSFLILLLLSFLTAARLNFFIIDYLNWLAVIFLAFLFFLILALKNFALIRRDFWYLVLNLSLFYLIFLNFFLINQSSWFVMKWLGFMALIFLLLKELLTPMVPKAANQSNIISLLLSLLIGEFLWIASWLPIGFLSLASLTLLLVMLLVNLTINYYLGKLGRRLVLIDVSLFLILLAVILLASKWTIN